MKLFNIHIISLCCTVFAIVLCSSCQHATTPQGHVQLDSLKRECSQAIDRFDYNTLHTLSAQYSEVAASEGDERHMAYAHFYQGASCLYTNKLDTAISELQLSRNIASQIGNDSVMALSLNSIGIHEATSNNNLYLAQWYFTESLKHAKKSDYIKLEGTIYGNLCTIAQMQNDTTLIEYAYECYNFGIQQKDPHLEFIGALHLCDMNMLKAQYDTALVYCRRAIDVSERNGLNDNAIAYVSLSGIMLQKENLVDADRHARTAIRLAEESSNKMVLANAYHQMAQICHERGQYIESNEWLERELDSGEMLEMVKSQIYELMARNHESLGNTNKALEYLTEAKKLADSTNISDRERLKREREMSFSIIEQEQQLEFNKQQLRTRGITIGALILLICLLLYVMWVTYKNARRRNELYKNIVRQHMDSIEREKELNERISQLEHQFTEKENFPDSQEDSTHEAAIAKSTPSAKSEQIYREVCRLMEQERIYTDPQLNRENLAQRVGTNKSYLTTIISECSGGKNLSQFINQYRIQEAVKILSDKDHIDYPLKQLCNDLGFGSVSTFYKLFQEGVGMSPSAYRKSFINMINTQQEN